MEGSIAVAFLAYTPPPTSSFKSRGQPTKMGNLFVLHISSDENSFCLFADRIAAAVLVDNGSFTAAKLMTPVKYSTHYDSGSIELLAAHN